MLGVDPVHIQFRWVLKGLLNGFFGDFVEHHPAVFFFAVADNLAQVPGNGFSFAVQIRGQINMVGIFGQTLEFFHHFFFTGQNLVMRFPVFVRINAHTANQLFARFVLFIDGFFFR